MTTTPQMTDKKAISCNLNEATSAAVGGAAAFVSQMNPGGGHDRVCVLLRSRSGRWVRKWESIGRLFNFRLKTIPPEHPRYGDGRILWGATGEQVAGLTAALRAAVKRKKTSV